MHEPYYEKGRANILTSYSLYFLNLTLSTFSNKILLASEQAIIKAKSFIKNEKIYQINLTFVSNSQSFLQHSLLDLKSSWETLKVFSLIGGAAKDRNLQGFIYFANTTNKNYYQRARFIRAGVDKDISFNYENEGILAFPGYINNSAKKFLFSLTHFMIIPYSFSTQSGVIAEALSYGKILIVNDIPAFRYLKDLSFAFVINFNDEHQILECLQRIFSMSVEDYEACYWDAIKYFNENHSREYLYDKLDKL
jgi:glycosyltransferase involved in cell wall biosynthesis